MFDLKNLDRWKRIGKGTAVPFNNKEPRKVRLEVLAEDVTVLRVGQGKGSAMFIGRFLGYDVVQFQVDGPWTLQADGGICYFWTPELEDFGAPEIPEAVSFTKIMNRRERNPELELLMKKVGDNMERRIAQVERDVNLRLSQERRIHEKELERERARLASEREAESLVQPSSDGDEDDGEESGG